jgi:hypothetical protein
MEHTRFIGLDIHKERISVAVAESGRSGAVEYLGEIISMNLALSASCATVCGALASHWRFVMRPDRDATMLARLHRAGELTPVWVPDTTRKENKSRSRGRPGLDLRRRQGASTSEIHPKDRV